MRVLGISAFYHDSAAALITDGEIVAAAQEERFTRKKHDASFPRHALEYCLSEAKIALDQVDLVAFYDKPFLKFERLLETYLAFVPRGFASFRMAIPIWLREKLFLKNYLTGELKQHRPDFDWDERLRLLLCATRVSVRVAARASEEWNEQLSSAPEYSAPPSIREVSSR